MSEELKVYAYFVKRLFDLDYGKERLFYDEGKWYDRHYGRYIDLEELVDELEKIFEHVYDLYEKEYS